MLLPGNLTDQEIQLIHLLRVDEEKLNAIEPETRQQVDCNKWKEERSSRFTASKFHLISKHQESHENFAESLLDPKPVSSKYLDYGEKYEPVALMEYEKFMSSRRTPVKVLPSGFIVSQGMPIIGSTPDARVIDFGCLRVQGQMAATKARWCDFIIYTRKGLHVQRIPFDPMFWESPKQKLMSYYFTHFYQICICQTVPWRLPGGQ